MEGTPPPAGASPTQPYKCGQYFKVKVKIKVNVFISAKAKIALVLILTLTF